PVGTASSAPCAGSATRSRAEPVPAPRRSWPLTWRGAVLAVAAMGALTVLAAATTFVVVRESLRASLSDALAADATKVAALYAAGAAGSARDLLQGPTGGVWVQLYDPLGELLVANQP